MLLIRRLINNYFLNQILSPVDIPLSLNLSSYMSIDASDDDKKEALYELSSVVVHDGNSLDFGHYVALVRRATKDPSKEGEVKYTWYMLNDHVVSVISEETALKIASGCKANSRIIECEGGVCRRVAFPTCGGSGSTGGLSSSASAYLVFYKKKHC